MSDWRTQVSRSGETHWRLGAIIGAASGVVLANVLVLTFDDDASVMKHFGFSLVGGAAAMMPGALIGGLFPKASPQEVSGKN